MQRKNEKNRRKAEGIAHGRLLACCVQPLALLLKENWEVSWFVFEMSPHKLTDGVLEIKDV